MSKMKLVLLVLMPFWLLFASGVSYGRYAAIMIDAENGNVLHEVDATHPWYPASLTKVMTLYMTFEALNTGQLHLYDNLTASGHASRQPTSKLGLRPGERLTVEDAILALITRSANDAAVVLAERLGGTEDNFAIKMTNKARSLGMHNTRFMNATGLPNEWQVTTSRDMAMLAWKIQRHFPEYYPYFSSHSFYYKGRELRGINKFTARYPGAEGMKTGYTCGSGFNLIGAAHQNGKHLIGVVLGGMTSVERYQLMMNMMDNGFIGQYNASTVQNIETMPTSLGGEPPYQLDCGSGARHHVIAQNQDKTSHRVTKKVAHGSKRHAKSYHVARHKASGSRKLVKTKSSARTKFASKKRGGTVKTAHAGKSTRSLKPSGKSRLTAKAKTSRKVKLARSGSGRSTTVAKSKKSSGYHRLNSSATRLASTRP